MSADAGTDTDTDTGIGYKDELIGQRFDVLDKGFVHVIDFMGDDSAVVDAARISYGAGTRKRSDDRGLIRYLMRHNHTTPFEMCEIKLGIKAPMDVWRQWVRHRTASVNEYSTRYSLAIDDKMCTDSREWRQQSKGNRQGSGPYIKESIGAVLSKHESDFHKSAAGLYESRIQAGVAREQARKDLPLSTYTEAYWKIDLHNLLHFLQLRMDSHAQLEIGAYAQIIATIVSQWVPLTWQAFSDYRLNGTTLSHLDKLITRVLVDSNFTISIAEAAKRAGVVGFSKREEEELRNKMIEWL